MNAEMPFLAAGAVTVAGGAIREKGWPPYTKKALIGTVALVIVASASNGTKVEPLVRAIGLLFFLSAVIAAVRYVNARGKAAGLRPRR